MTGPEQLDSDDRLAGARDRFVDSANDLVYFDGNSLGRPLRVTGERLARFVDEEWGGRLIRGWDERWLDLPTTIGDELGRVCLGAAPGQTIIGDSTTVLLYKMMRAAVAARPGRREIVIDRDNFPTDRYVAAGIAEELGLALRWIDVDTAAGVTTEQVAAAVGPDTALVVVSHVAYRSAWLADLPEITRIAHDAGALVLRTSATRRVRSRSSSTPGTSTSPSGARTSTSTAAPARRPSCTSPNGCSTSSPSRSGAGWEPPTRS